jgi:predicted dehydrogenase
MSEAVTIALVGCGAIAQEGYLPALRHVPEVRCRWVIDTDEQLAIAAARKYAIPMAGRTTREIHEHVDGVVLAVPNHLHADLAIELIDQGSAVLCEKPLGRSVEEVRAMVAAADRRGVPLLAAMIMRQYPGLQILHETHRWSSWGHIGEVRISYGRPLNWPMREAAYFGRHQSGGGVWLDLGVHVLDTLWFSLPCRSMTLREYADDASVGVEAEAHARLTVDLGEWGHAVPCTVDVSRLRRLPNRLEIVTAGGSVSVPLSGQGAPRVRSAQTTQPLADVVRRGPIDCFGAQLRAFARAIRGLTHTGADGRSQIRVLETIEAGYAGREPLVMPWERYAPWPSN